MNILELVDKLGELQWNIDKIWFVHEDVNSYFGVNSDSKDYKNLILNDYKRIGVKSDIVQDYIYRSRKMLNEIRAEVGKEFETSGEKMR